ncbi:hypothetical protein B0H11DRAFT_2007111 [Mycena galericulata]|nr:hypothetical protein B0H11DRAFT_2007111 [Mycena galericulata]
MRAGSFTGGLKGFYGSLCYLFNVFLSLNSQTLSFCFFTGGSESTCSIQVEYHSMFRGSTYHIQMDFKNERETR